MTATHSDGRTSNTGALRHEEAIAMIDVIRTECPHAFAMKKNWKPANPDYKRPPSKATPELVEFSGGIPLPPTVVNLKYDKFDIRIDRRSEYGNPFHIGKDGNRTEVIAKFRQHLARRIIAGKVTHAQLVTMETPTDMTGYV